MTPPGEGALGKRASILAVSAILAGALVALAIPAAAGPPAGVSFSITGNFTGSAPDPGKPAPFSGHFDSSGEIVDAGELIGLTETIMLWETIWETIMEEPEPPIRWRWQIESEEGKGTAEIQGQGSDTTLTEPAEVPSGTSEGTWRIVAGEGAYADLVGRGGTFLCSFVLREGGHVSCALSRTVVMRHASAY